MVATSLKLQEPPPDMEIDAHITVAQSYVDTTRLGLWCKTVIPAGSRFGPFSGEKAVEVTDKMDPAYMWEIVDVETKEFLFYINATDPKTSNWMRYINCVRFDMEPNIGSEQDGIDIYYKALKDIQPGEELLTSMDNFDMKRRRGKPRNLLEIKRANVSPSVSKTATPPSVKPVSARKTARTTVDSNSVSQRGRKRSLKKYYEIDAVADGSAVTSSIRDSEKRTNEIKQDNVPDKQHQAREQKASSKSNVSVDKPQLTKSNSKLAATSKSFPNEGKLAVVISAQFFHFDLRLAHTAKNRLGRKIFQCIICSGIYRHGFSLKRHFVRNHVTEKYVNKVDALNCNIGQQHEKGDDLGEEKESDDEESVVDGDSVVDEKIGNDSLVTENEKLTNLKTNKDFDGEKEISMKRNDSSKRLDVDTETKKSEIDQSISADDPCISSGTMNLEVDEITEFSPPASTQSSLEEELEEGDGSFSLGKKQSLPGLYRCNICDCQFDTVDELKDHFVNHPNNPNDKKFSCGHCQMKFKHKQNLMRHEVVHSGAKPFVCGFCDKRFPTLTNRKRHERIHKGQRLSCEQCPGTFTQAGDLKKHMRKLHPETYQECAYCAKYYSSETALGMHLMKAHGKNSDANNRQISARRSAQKISLELDQAESRHLASIGYDGPSMLLEFRCTVCVKKFHDYTNMCRHRRLAHGQGAPRVSGDRRNDEDDFSSFDEASESGSQLTGWAAMDAQQLYFAQISSNITNNLQNYVEGKADQLSQASSHIRWKLAQDSIDAATKNDISGNTGTTQCSIRFEEFNFPVGFEIRDAPVTYDVSREIAPPSCDDVPNGSNMQTEEVNSVIPTMAAQSAGTDDSVNCRREVLRVPEINSCNVCHAVFANNASLVEHKSIKHAPMNLTTGNNSSTVSHMGNSSKNEHVSLSNIQNNDDLDKNILDLSLKGEISDSVAIEPVKQAKKFLCLVCFREFNIQTDLFSHQRERHANIDCRHVEVDMDYNATWCQRPNSVGTLNVSCSQLPAEPDNLSDAIQLNFQCTKCKKSFPTRNVLHQHIFDCGDYWRDIHKRVMWVFVLRGSEVPATDKTSKKRGKFHWSPHDSQRKQISGQQKAGGTVVGDTAVDAPSSGSRRSMRALARQRSSDSPPDDNDTTTRRSYQRTSTYSPWRHVRRRQSAPLVDTQKCRGCGETFETILQLERHIPVCTEKQRLKELHAMEDGIDDSDGDNDFDPTKHMCIYCERQFTYMRTLRKHVTENCSVRRDLMEKGEYIDLEWEQDVAKKVQNFSSASVAVSRDLSQNFSEVDGVEGASGDGHRGGKFRRRRGNNWGCRQKSTRRSYKSGDEIDSLFGWEDAYLSMQGKDDADRLLGEGSSLVNQEVENRDTVKDAASDYLRNVLISDAVVHSKLVPGLSSVNKDELEQTVDTRVNLVKNESVISMVLEKSVLNSNTTIVYKSFVDDDLTKSAKFDALKHDIDDVTLKNSVGIVKIRDLVTDCGDISGSGDSKVSLSASCKRMNVALCDRNDGEDVKYSNINSASSNKVKNDKDTAYDQLSAGDINHCDIHLMQEEQEPSAAGAIESNNSQLSRDLVGDGSEESKLSDDHSMSNTAGNGGIIESPSKSRRRKGVRLTMKSKKRKSASPRIDKANKTDMNTA